MNLKTHILVFALFLSSLAQCQQDSLVRVIKSQVYNRDKSKRKLDSLVFTLDTIHVSAKYNSSKIITDNLLSRSKQVIRVTYFFKNKSLILIRTSQENKKVTNGEWISDFYFHHGKLIKKEYHGKMTLECIGYSMDDLIPDNPISFDATFLQKFLLQIQQKLKLS